MRLTAPKKTTYLIALAVGVLGVVSGFVELGSLTAYAFWFVAAAFVTLALAIPMDGL